MSQPCLDGWVLEDCDCPALDVSPPEDHPAVDMAKLILFEATGGQYGSCEHTVTVCDRAGCHCSYFHGCCDGPSIALPGPVVSVSEVVIYAGVLDEGTYRVEDWKYLRRLDGSWPSEVTVTYMRGFDPPAGSGTALAELACEIAKGICGDNACALPKRIASKTRQGISIRYPDFEEGRTGLPLVDMWIAAAKAPRKLPRIYSPDNPVYREVTWEASP